jgi:peptidoglycan/LPS O-acetylase OafA/YrhL
MTTLRAPRGSAASDHLDLMRGFCAVAVLVGNGRTLFFLDYDRLSEAGAAATLWYFVTGLAHPAVMAFFVLSGFFVGGAVLAAAGGGWSWRAYLAARTTRLYPVLLAGLALTAMWDHIGLRLGSNVYTAAHGMTTLVYPVADNLGVGTLLGNLAFLQTLVVRPFGSNGPLWSLCNEFWYYVLFPPFVLAVVPGTRTPVRVAAAVFAAALLATVFRPLAYYFVVWLMGAAVALMPAPLRQRPGAARAVVAAALLAFAGGLAVGRLRWGGAWSDLATGAGTALLVWAIVQAGNAVPSPRRYAAAARGLAGCSFTLYVTHYPLLVLLRAGLEPFTPFAVSLAGALGFFLVAAAVGVYGWGIAQVVEPQTERLRRVLARWSGFGLAANPTLG